ncbi:hypothetical protein DM02DRAFT_618499 [Periconia macrospinosa]|uniref:Uncharacterized protein n=1 Tax=Periconia macrospinosa TaxID=97972 RepID=A0A2V1D8Z1_9PLEO|nr:hypothetical protein DM02DRAFT_618499 [Periconia macrospinosa]
MQLLANLLAIFAIFQIAIAAAADKFPIDGLVARQATTGATTGGVDPCVDYSIIANMSVISKNSSYRAAYMMKAPVGTITTANMLNAAQAKLPALTADVALNNQCGNLTTVAITEAANNFTKGIVAQFTTEGLPVGIDADWRVIFSVIFCCVLLSVVWVFAE